MRKKDLSCAIGAAIILIIQPAKVSITRALDIIAVYLL